MNDRTIRKEAELIQLRSLLKRFKGDLTPTLSAISNESVSSVGSQQLRDETNFFSDFDFDTCDEEEKK